MKIYLISIICLLISLTSSSQSVRNHMITPASASYNNGHVQGVWSLGEMENGNKDIGDLIVLQGFIKNNVTIRITQIDDELKNNINIYPNPVADKLVINWNTDIGEVNYQLSDLEGNLLINRNTNTTPDQHEEIDIANLKNGIYLLQVTKPRTETPVVIKLVKQK